MVAGSHLLAGCPCVAVRPARSCPWAAPPDCTPLPGSLKDQEENLSEVKRGHQGKKREDTPDNQRLSQQQPKHDELFINHTHTHTHPILQRMHQQDKRRLRQHNCPAALNDVYLLTCFTGLGFRREI